MENKKTDKSKNLAETKVMRLNEKEVKLINFLREDNIELLLSELRSTLNNSPNKRNFKTQKRLINIFEERKSITLDSLIDMKFISRSQADYLIECVTDNKNILITGSIGVGKTTLLSALIDYISTDRVMVLEEYPEICISEKSLNKTIIHSKNTEHITMKDISTILEMNIKRFIRSEIKSSDDILGVFSVLKNDCSVLGTAYCSSGNWREQFLTFFTDDTKNQIEKMMSNYKFVQVDVIIDSKGKRIVSDIKEA